MYLCPSQYKIHLTVQCLWATCFHDDWNIGRVANKGETGSGQYRYWNFSMRPHGNRGRHPVSILFMPSKNIYMCMKKCGDIFHWQSHYFERRNLLLLSEVFLIYENTIKHISKFRRTFEFVKINVSTCGLTNSILRLSQQILQLPMVAVYTILWHSHPPISNGIMFVWVGAT